MTEVSDLGHRVGWTQLKGVHFNPIKCKIKYLWEKASGSLTKRGNLYQKTVLLKKKMGVILKAKYMSSQDCVEILKVPRPSTVLE